MIVSQKILFMSRVSFSLLWSQEIRQISAETDLRHRDLAITCNPNDSHPFYNCLYPDYMEGDKDDKDNKILIEPDTRGHASSMAYSQRRDRFYLSTEANEGVPYRTLIAYEGSTNSKLGSDIEDIVETRNWQHQIDHTIKSIAMDKEEDNIYVLHGEKVCGVSKYNIDTRALLVTYPLNSIACESHYPRTIAVGSEYFYVGWQNKGRFEDKPYIAASKHKLDGTHVKEIPSSSNTVCVRGVHVDEEDLLWCGRHTSLIRYNQDETAVTVTISKSNLPDDLKNTGNEHVTFFDNAHSFALDTSSQNVHISASGRVTTNILVFTYAGVYVGKTETNPNAGSVQSVFVWPGNNAAYIMRGNGKVWNYFTLNLPTNPPTTKFEGQDFDFKNVVTQFIDEDNVFSIMMTYTVGESIGLMKTTLYEKTCTTAILDTIIRIAPDQNVAYSGNFVKKIIIDRQKLSESALVTKTDESISKGTSGTLSFCVKSEGTSSNDISVSFQKDKVNLQYDLTSNDFTVKSNKIVGNSIVTTSKDVTTAYSVIANKCDSTTYDTVDPATPLQQNSLAFICIKPNSTSVRISNFNLSFVQVGFSFPAVTIGSDGWVSSALSSISSEGDKIKVVSRLVTSLFENGKTTFDATGNAFLAFQTSRRDLASMHMLQDLPEQESAGEASFGIDIKLQKLSVSSEESNSAGTIAVSILSFLALVFAFIIMKKMKK